MRKKELFGIGSIYVIIFGVYYLIQYLFFNSVIIRSWNQANISIFLPWLVLIIYIISIWNIFKLKIKHFILFGEIGVVSILITDVIIIFFPVYFYSPYTSLFLISCVVISIIYNLIYIIIILINLLRFKAEKMIIIFSLLNNAAKYARLEVREISEDCQIDRDTVIRTIKKFLPKGEIDAEYFENSHSIAFNQQANMMIIDELISKYKEMKKPKF